MSNEYDNFKKLYEYIKKNLHLVNGNANISKLYSNYFQVSLVKNNKKYPLNKVHFEILRDKYDKNKCFLDLHFEEEDTTRYKNNSILKQIVDNDTDADWIQWRYNGKNNFNNQSIRFKKKFNCFYDKEKNDLLNFLTSKHKKYNNIILNINNEISFTENSIISHP